MALGEEGACRASRRAPAPDGSGPRRSRSVIEPVGVGATSPSRCSAWAANPGPPSEASTARSASRRARRAGQQQTGATQHVVADRRLADRSPSPWRSRSCSLREPDSASLILAELRQCPGGGADRVGEMEDEVPGLDTAIQRSIRSVPSPSRPGGGGACSRRSEQKRRRTHSGSFGEPDAFFTVRDPFVERFPGRREPRSERAITAGNPA